MKIGFRFKSKFQVTKIKDKKGVNIPHKVVVGPGQVDVDLKEVEVN